MNSHLFLLQSAFSYGVYFRRPYLSIFLSIICHISEVQLAYHGVQSRFFLWFFDVFPGRQQPFPLAQRPAAAPRHGAVTAASERGVHGRGTRGRRLGDAVRRLAAHGGWKMGITAVMAPFLPVISTNRKPHL